jgi:16S rRNA (cytidine1402-2'-O)-methyltransferase
MSKLYLVPTPIGNLRDITFRALEVLADAGLVLAEDTRQTGKLLSHYNIKTPLQSHHMFNEHRSVEAICSKIELGTTVALVSDAGTPGISDPGFLLVRTCIEKGIQVETLPGPTALIPALVNSGFPCDRF